MVYSALAFAQSEVLWYFQHVGIASSKSRAARMVPVEIVRNFHHISLLCIKLLCYYAVSSLTVCSGVFDFPLMSMQDPSDPTIGFLLDGMDRLCCLVRKYIAG